MDREALQKSVFDYFEDKSLPLPENPAERLALNYLDQQLIDSMGIVELITDFEARYGIQFTAEDLQSSAFQTIGGLVDIVSQRVGEK